MADDSKHLNVGPVFDFLKQFVGHGARRFYGDYYVPDGRELDDYDYRNTITRLEVPAYFISGEYDYNCPWELVEEYFEGLDAPAKGFYKIKDSAHSPLWENAGDSMEIMKNIREMTENGR